jgi:integrase
MAVRKRQWHTRAQAQALAKQQGVGLKDAEKTLRRAVRENNTQLLEQYPPKEAWVVEYTDNGVWRLKTFKLKKEADTYRSQVSVDIGKGVHVAPSKSITVVEAGDLWIKTCEAEELQRATVDGYKQHLRLHINPRLGKYKLSTLTVPLVRKFKDDLRDDGRSRALIRAIMVSLGALLADAQERGFVATNVVRSMKQSRKGKRKSKKEQKKGLKVGVDIPTPEEIKRLIAHLPDKWRPLLLTAIFSGLRSSELRGLRWEDVELRHVPPRLHVRQRADRYNEVDVPKSESGERTVPLPPMVVNTLREWKLKCPKGEDGRLVHVFPTGAGEIEYHSNIVNRGLGPIQIAAGITKHGKPKYRGLHSLRHFYASWCINRQNKDRPEEGGLGLLPKEVQARMGHSSITVTMDTYGHLFPKSDDGAELKEAERYFFA